jgi:hypothetical protein
MILPNVQRGLCASEVSAIVLALTIAIGAPARAETWELDVATARAVADEQSGGGFVSILLSEAGVDLFDRLTKEATGPAKEVRVDGLAISLARYDRARRELRVRLRDMSYGDAQALAGRLASKTAKVEVIDAAEK